MRSLALCVASLALLDGCSSDVATQSSAPQRPVPGQPAVQPAPAPQIPVYEPPTGALEIPCIVRAEIEATVTPRAVHASIVLRNLSSQAANVTLREACPGGPVTLHGLEPAARYDPMHTCRMGACVTPTVTRTYTIPARGEVQLARTTLDVRGDACNAELPFGSTFLRAEVVTEPRQPEVCSGTPLHIVRDHETKRLRRASLTEPLVPRAVPSRQPLVKHQPLRTQPPKPPPQKPQPAKQTSPKSCPACGFACLGNEMPSRRTDENGCPICGCDPIGL